MQSISFMKKLYVLVLILSGIIFLFSEDFKVSNVYRLSETEQKTTGFFDYKSRDTFILGSDGMFKSPYRFRCTSGMYMDNKVSVWNLASGKEVWKLYLDGFVNNYLLRGKQVYALTNRTITCINMETGSILWQFDLKQRQFRQKIQLSAKYDFLNAIENQDETHFSPSFLISLDSNKLVLQPLETVLEVYDIPSKTLLKSIDIKSNGKNKPANTLVALETGFLSIGLNGLMNKYNWDFQGEWSFKFAKNDSLLQPVLEDPVNKNIYFVCQEKIYVLNRWGKLITKTGIGKLNGPVASSLYADSGSIVLGDESHGLYCYDLSMKKKWFLPYSHKTHISVMLVYNGDFSMSNSVIKKIGINGRNYFVFLENRTVYFVDAETGEIDNSVILLDKESAEDGGWGSVFSFGLNSITEPYYNEQENKLTFVVTVITGEVKRSLDKHIVEEYAVELSW